jgi:hypothetical protein
MGGDKCEEHSSGVTLRYTLGGATAKSEVTMCDSCGMTVENNKKTLECHLRKRLEWRMFNEGRTGCRELIRRKGLKDGN